MSESKLKGWKISAKKQFSKKSFPMFQKLMLKEHTYKYNYITYELKDYLTYYT